MRKAAVVIGVNKTGQLTPLRSAAAGAERVALWLSDEGFDVRCLTDAKQQPVTSADVEDALASFVTVPPRYHLLLVYFSGHGYWHARSDQWLLSNAPTKPHEAVNLERAINDAKYCGIPNVVFVSDACRSIPNTRAGAMVDGVGLFPNFEEITSTSKIDFFKATSESLPAFEIPINGEATSVLTAALMAAFEQPDADVVREITLDAQTIRVVPNRQLESMLQRKVDALLATEDPLLSQRLEINVPSGDDVYISRVRMPLVPVAPLPAPAPVAPTPGQDAAATISRVLTSRAFAGADATAELVVDTASTERAVELRLPDPSIDHFETTTGFVFSGDGVLHAVLVRSSTSRGWEEAKVLVPGGHAGGPGLVRVSSREAASVLVVLESGRVAILAALPGYVGHVIVEADGISNVSYVPSSNHPRFADYHDRGVELNRLRAMVALAVDQNTFRVSSKREANGLAERIRIAKAIDPTLGLYAGVAFAQAGNETQIVELLRTMRADLNADLLDVRLLAGRSAIAMADDDAEGSTAEGGTAESGEQRMVSVVPCCPMLTQSWHLRPAQHMISDATAPWGDPRWAALRPFLCASLWTTFTADAYDVLSDLFPEAKSIL